MTAILRAAAFCAMLATPAVAHEPVEWMGHVYTTHIEAAESGGSLGLIHANFPAYDGPPMHVHDDAEETFHVLSGEVILRIGDEDQILGAGDSGIVPRGTEHGFHVTSPEGADLLVMFTPGGFEGFFAAVAAENLEIPRDMDRIAEISEEYHLRIVGPPMKVEAASAD